MATLVCFHAHPDDEAISTGGTMLLASRAGHRVVLVLATRGEQGEPVPGVLAEGEVLGDRRERETRLSAGILGAHRVEFLGYEDSGMMGEPANDNPACFWRADLDEAAGRLADILREEKADVVTIYDEHGGYGHPDHINVHRVGTRAAELAGIGDVFWATMNRTRIIELMEASSTFDETMDEERLDRVSAEEFGTPEDELTHAIDVCSVLAEKRAAMAAHASQISSEDFFLALPLEEFAAAFGTEWFVKAGAARTGAPFESRLLA